MSVGMPEERLRAQAFIREQVRKLRESDRVTSVSARGFLWDMYYWQASPEERGTLAMAAAKYPADGRVFPLVGLFVGKELIPEVVELLLEELTDGDIPPGVVQATPEELFAQVAEEQAKRTLKT